MKLAFTLSLLFPLVFADAKLPGDGVYWWTISTKNATLKAADNLFLTPSRGGKFYLTASGGSAFWSTPYNETQTLSFHAGPENHQLALQVQRGQKGLMTFVDIVGPSEHEGPTAEMIPKDTPTEWSVFKIGPGWGGGPLLVKDGQDIPTRQWITYVDETDGDDHVGLWDGVTPQSRPFKNITLIVTTLGPAGT